MTRPVLLLLAVIACAMAIPKKNHKEGKEVSASGAQAPGQSSKNQSVSSKGGKSQPGKGESTQVSGRSRRSPKEEKPAKEGKHEKPSNRDTKQVKSGPPTNTTTQAKHANKGKSASR